MRYFGVAELKNEGVSRTIGMGMEACFSSLNNKDSALHMVMSKDVEKLLRLKPELLIFSQNWADCKMDWREASAYSGTLLVPGTRAAEIGPHIRAKCAVSYGMSARDTITLSSINDKKLVLALQRELVTIDGTVLERQELSVRREFMVTTPEDFMAAAGGLLLLGVLPEQLSG